MDPTRAAGAGDDEEPRLKGEFPVAGYPQVMALRQNRRAGATAWSASRASRSGGRRSRFSSAPDAPATPTTRSA